MAAVLQSQTTIMQQTVEATMSRLTVFITQLAASTPAGGHTGGLLLDACRFSDVGKFNGNDGMWAERSLKLQAPQLAGESEIIDVTKGSVHGINMDRPL